MQLTLKQARRVEREIGKELERETTHNVDAANTVSIYEDLREKVSAAQESILADLTKVRGLVRIRFAIRKEIETQNEAAGLNKLMNREAELKAMLAVLQQLMVGELTDAELEVAFQRHAAAKSAAANGTVVPDRYGRPTDEVTLNSVIRTDTMEVVRANAKLIQHELVATADALAGLNASTKVVLDDADAKLLEKAGIVL